MRIFYILLSIILLNTTRAECQAKGPLPDTDHKVVKKFYPNPAVSYIIFDIDMQPNESYRLQIYSFLGKLVKDIPNMADHNTVNLADLTRGLYTFQVRDQSGRITDSGLFQLNK
ncbi:MAG TPA: T9SS type A sorting domain-containing protein [Puia sp.]|nr:T9SS type A sorting domain-containing protein [Puia sp.]